MGVLGLCVLEEQSVPQPLRGTFLPDTKVAGHHGDGETWGWASLCGVPAVVLLGRQSGERGLHEWRLEAPLDVGKVGAKLMEGQTLEARRGAKGA